MFVKDESTGPRRVGVMSDVHHAMRSFIWSWQSMHSASSAVQCIRRRRYVQRSRSLIARINIH